MNKSRIEAFGLLERDVNDDVMCVWSYPGIERSHGEILVARCGLQSKKISDAYRWSKFGSTWQYMQTVPVDDIKVSRVNAACIVVLSEQFNPEKFRALLSVLAESYRKSYSPRPLLEAFLKIFRTAELPGWSDSKFDNRRALIAGSIKATVKSFGQQIALLWTAIVLKKRIFVYADSVSEVLSLVRIMPLFGSWHRQNWGILRPLVCLGETELQDLAKSKVYVAGTTDARCSSKEGFYDLFVDATSAKMSVPSHAKAGMAMTKFHKDFAKTIMRAAQSESDQGVIKAVALKTRALIDNVKKIKAELNVRSLKLADFAKIESISDKIARFFFDVAVAEGLAS